MVGLNFKVNMNIWLLSVLITSSLSFCTIAVSINLLLKDLFEESFSMLVIGFIMLAAFMLLFQGDYKNKPFMQTYEYHMNNYK